IGVLIPDSYRYRGIVSAMNDLGAIGPLARMAECLVPACLDSSGLYGCSPIESVASKLGDDHPKSATRQQPPPLQPERSLLSLVRASAQLFFSHLAPRLAL